VPCCDVSCHAVLQERIAELEGEAMGDRPWQLKGEVAAAQRPLNSALEVRVCAATALLLVLETRGLAGAGRAGYWPLLPRR
jgi:hypothetical protein